MKIRNLLLTGGLLLGASNALAVPMGTPAPSVSVNGTFANGDLIVGGPGPNQIQDSGQQPVKSFSGPAAPGVSNDSTQGYAVGSVGYNTVNGNLYIAKSVTAGGAVWALVDYARVNAVAGNWYLPLGQREGAAGVAITTTTMGLEPFFIPETMTISAIGSRVTTVGTTNIQLAIYASDGATSLPTGAPLASTGNIADTVAGPVSATLSTAVRLAPGLYWVGVECGDATAIVASPPANIALTAQIIGTATLAAMAPANGNSNFVSGLALSGTTFGTWPTLSPVLANYGESLNGNRGPLLLYQVQSVP